MQKARRSLSAFLALAMLLSVMVFPANAADSGYELAILSVQRMTAGTAFSETAPAITEETSMSEGDIVVLTVGFRNTSGAAVDVDGFAATVLFDKTKVSPYKGTSPFMANPYQINSSFLLDYSWSQAGKGDGDGFVSASSGGSAAYSVANNAELFLVRMAFQVNADVGDATAVFRFDQTEGRSSVTSDGGKAMSLEDLKTFKLKIGEGGAVDEPDDPGNSDNPGTDPETAADQQLYISAAQTLTPGSAFDPDAAQKVTSAKPGNVIVLTISGKNNKTDAELKIGGFAATVLYDKTKVTPYTGTSPFMANPYQINSSFLLDYGWSQAGKGDGDGFVSASSGGSAAYSVAAGGETFLVRMAFQVNSDATNGLAAFTFDATEARSGLTDADGKALDVGTLKAFNLIIGDPVPTTVAVTPAKAELSVPASGSATQAFTAEVRDQGGNAMTGQTVTWSMTPNNVSGVTLTDGTVSVASNAAVTADTPFTVTATSGSISGTATLTVKSGATSDLSATLDNQSQQTVPADRTEDVTFDAKITSASGADVSGATWSVEVENADGTRTPADASTGVTVDATGKVTVTAAAKAGKYYVVATVGDSKAEVPVTVQGDEAGSLTLSPNPATITVPAAGNPEPLTFTVKDSNNADVDNATLTWTLSETPAGVSIGEKTGVVTVDKSAYTGNHTVTVTATLSETVSGTAQLTIQEAAAVPVLDKVELSRSSSVVDGTVADPATITATAVGDIDGTLDNVTWAVTAKPENAAEDAIRLSATSGELVTLTISPTAAVGEYTITATQTAGEAAPVVKTATLTVSQKKPATMTVTGNRASIEIPGTGSSDETARFTATDSNGNAIPSNDLTWTVVDRDTGTELKRTSVDWATDPDNEGSMILTVKPLAREEIVDTHDASSITGKTLVVTATRTNGDSDFKTVVVRRADPVLKIVTLTLGDKSASTGETPLAIASNGDGAQTVTSVAKDQYEEAFDSTERITWALRSGGNGLVISGSGVEINANTGVITVNGNAKHGTYIVEATRTVMERQQVASAEMTVSQGDEVVSDLTISGGTLEMTVPGKDDEDNVLSDENAFVARVFNQYGSTMPDAPVVWSITNSAGAVVEGVTIDNGKVRVAYAAKDAIPANTRPIFTVKASSGSVEKTARIYITRSAPYLYDLLLDGQNSITKSIDGTQDTAVQGTALDQYETPYAGTVTWNVTPDGLSGNGGVTVDSATAVITILKNATPGYYSVTAVEGSAPAVGPKRLLVSREAPIPSNVIISGGQTTIWIPGDNDEPTQSVPFVATVKDQFNSDMAGQTVVWTITDSSGNPLQGITIDNGIVSVTNEVKALITTSNYQSFRTMNVNASCGSVSATPAQIIVGRAVPALSKVQLNGSDSTAANKATFNYTDGQTMTITATALDQYSSIFPNTSWSISSYTDKIGVSIAPNGVITVSNGAVSGEYTAIASYGEQEVSAPFLLKKTGSVSTALSKVLIDPATVTVSSSSMAISQANAYDGENNLISAGILWSVHPDGQGVSVDANGRITVSPNAQGRVYVVTATPDNAFGTVTGNAQSSDLTVQRADAASAELDHIILTKTSVTVNGNVGETANAGAYDRTNQAVSGVTWTVSPSDGGVGIDANGVISVFRSANPGEYIIRGTKNGVSKEATLTVVNNAATAIANVILNPSTVIVDGISPASATARAVDAGNGTLSDVSWSVTPNDKGVTIAANGAITVAGNAMLGNYDVTATNSAGARTATLVVSDQPAADETLTGVTLTPASVTLDGTAKTVSAAAQGTASDISWSVEPQSAGVTLNSATGKTVQLTVAANATAGNYVVTAIRGETRVTATLRVSASSSALTGVTVSPASVTVNGTAAQTVTATATPSGLSGVSWSVEPLGNGVTVNALTGVVTVAATAKSGEYAVTATQGGGSQSATLTVSNATPAATVTLDSVTLNPATVTLSGAAATSTATAISSANASIPAGVIWSVSPTSGGVSIDTTGAISVTATAVSGEYTVTAQYLGAVRSATLTVASNADITYEEKAVDQSAVSGTPLATLTYDDTGVKSVEGRSAVKSAALAKQNVQQAVAQQSANTETDIVVSMEIKLQSYDAANSSMRLSVTPVYEIVQTTNGTRNTLPGGTLDELPAPVTVSLNVPAGFDASFAKHTHNSTTYYEPITYTGTDANRVASWSQQYFSDVELTKDAVTVTFDASGGAAVSPMHIAKGGTLSALPATVRAGYNFSGWYLGATQVTTATVFNQDSTLVAQWAIASNTGGGGGSSSGGGGGGGSSSGGSSSGGGSSGGSSSSSSGVAYTVKLSSGSGGSLSASSAKATAETVVTVTPTPNAGYELDTLTVKTTTAKKDVAVTERNGTYTFEMPKNSVTVTATFKRMPETPANTDTGNTGNSSNNGNDSSNTTPPPSYTSVSFVDMQPDNFFYTAVQWAVERGITNGTTATTFSPNQACTRAQMVMFLWRSQGMPMPSSYNSPFTDVDPSANYYTAMMWAVERGITNGTTPTTFDPYAACTRAQMVMFLHRVAGRPRPTQWNCPFTDITVGENYYEPMLWALEKGITNGTTATTFSPYQACTRAQMVMFLYRYLGGN